MINLFLPGQPYPCNEAGTKIDHSSIDSRQVCVWIEHKNRIANKRRKTCGLPNHPGVHLELWS
jgi:hypothetical protein